MPKPWQLPVSISLVPQVLQLLPFIDVSTAWKNGDSPNPDSNTLVGVGIGLLGQLGDRFSAWFDWGIPLVSIATHTNSRFRA